MSILTFLIEHAAIVGGILVVALSILGLEWYEGEKQKRAIDLAKGIESVNTGTHQWVDVRDLKAFNQSHIIDAKHVSQLKQDKAKSAKTIIAYCDDGSQSAQWAEQNQTHYLKDGMLAWKKEQLPLVSKQTEEVTS